MLGYDSPEMKPKLTVTTRHDEMAAAKVSRNFLRSVLEAQQPICAEFYGPDKYGRPLVKLTSKDGTDINALMVSQGYGVPYDGGTKRPWKPVTTTTITPE